MRRIPTRRDRFRAAAGPAQAAWAHQINRDGRRAAAPRGESRKILSHDCGKSYSRSRGKSSGTPPLVFANLRHCVGRETHRGSWGIGGNGSRGSMPSCPGPAAIPRRLDRRRITEPLTMGGVARIGPHRGSPARLRTLRRAPEEDLAVVLRRPGIPAGAGGSPFGGGSRVGPRPDGRPIARRTVGLPSRTLGPDRCRPGSRRPVGRGPSGRGRRRSGRTGTVGRGGRAGRDRRPVGSGQRSTRR